MLERHAAHTLRLAALLLPELRQEVLGLDELRVLAPVGHVDLIGADPREPVVCPLPLGLPPSAVPPLQRRELRRSQAPELTLCESEVIAGDGPEVEPVEAGIGGSGVASSVSLPKARA